MDGTDQPNDPELVKPEAMASTETGVPDVGTITSKMSTVARPLEVHWMVYELPVCQVLPQVGAETATMIGAD